MAQCTLRAHRFGRPIAALVVLEMAVACLVGCSGGSSTDRLGGTSPPPEDSPRFSDVLFVDVDQNGVDEGDLLILQFHLPVAVQGTAVDGFEFGSDTESFGKGAVLRQSLPGSDRVELTLGEDPVLVPGSTELNVAESGEGVIQVSAADDFGLRARPRKSPLVILDATTSAPVLVSARVVDADGNGSLGAGDSIVASFNKPVAVPPGATVAANFTLPVTGDSFGAAPTLAAASSLEANRAVVIVLGAGASVTARGEFSAGNTGLGSPSALAVGPSPTITDTVASSTQVLSPGVVVDIGESIATPFGNGREADGIVGATDAFAGRLSAQSMKDPAGSDAFTGVVTIGDTSVPADLLFLADRGNDRVLIFADFPSGSFASARWVLGQPDFATSSSDDPLIEGGITASASNMDGPSDVAFDAESNRLFVADTGHHRVLVWDDLFRVGIASGALELENGKPASFALGQASLTTGDANRGLGNPTASTLSSPRGISIASSRLAVADTGNHRVLIFGSLPADASAAPSTVLGQADFQSGGANRGGTVNGASLSSPEDVHLSANLSVNGSTGAVLIADTGNNRVLVYASAAPASGSAANVALGQPDLVSPGAATSATGLRGPAGVVAERTASSIYVADRDNHRVMTYSTAGALANGAAGAAIGQASATEGLPNRGGAPAAGTLSSPGSVEIAGTALVVSDAGNHRVLVYGGTSLPTTHRDATEVLGQSTFTSGTSGGRRYDQPTDALLVGGKLVVADTGNHRVLIYNTPPTTGDPDPNVVLGQADLFATQPNRGGAATLATLNLPGGIASDGVRLAVADTGNHRVLIWSSIPAANGAPADVVLGQTSASGTSPNGGGRPSAATMNAPEGLSVAEDVLFIADRDNNRVLEFAGFQSLATGSPAAVVLGQPRFDAIEANRGETVGRGTLRGPRDVLAEAGKVFVADTGNHRVLVWFSRPTKDGQPADGLFGQGSFETATAGGVDAGSLAEPAGLAMDSSGDTLVVSDTAHHRIVLFNDTRGEVPDRREAGGVLGQRSLVEAQMDPAAPTFTTLEIPRGLFFNGFELYAADAGTSRIALFR